MRPWIIWCFVLFNLAMLSLLITHGLLDAGVLPWRAPSGGMFGSYFIYEMIVLFTIGGNLFLALLAVFNRRK